MLILDPILEQSPVSAVIKRNVLELTHELQERDYETDGQVKYVKDGYRRCWELEFAKGEPVYTCSFYESGFMQIVVAHASAYRDTIDALLNEFENLL